MSIDTSQKTEAIDQLYSSIERGDVVLPEFQRDFVWEEPKTYDLFDSLIRDVFIGSLIFGVPSFEITVRELDTRPRRGPGSRKKIPLKSYNRDEVQLQVKTGQFRLLLDGQQRATSLFRALKGVDDVWIVLKGDDEISPDVAAKPQAERTLEDVLYEVTGEESSERLSIRVSDAFRMLRGDILRERDKAQLLSATKFCAGKSAEEVHDSPTFESYLTYTDKFQNLLRAEKLLSYYLLDTNEEKFSLFFERSNSKGLQLSFVDILAAKLYAGFNLRQKAEEFEDENLGYELSQSDIARTIAFIVSDGRDIGRQFILATLTASHFNEYWPETCKLYRKSLDYLGANHYVVSQAWLPYGTMLIPLMVFLREIPSQDFSQLTELQRRFIKYWYWSAIFSQRYSSGALSEVLSDARVLRSLARNQFDFDRRYFSRFPIDIASAEDLLSISKKTNVIYKAVLNLVIQNAGGLRDWKSNSYVAFNTPLDDHHIFPRDYLKKHRSDLESSVIDSVLNRTLIPKITNIKIGSKQPSVYLGELAKTNPSLPASLKSHLIPIGALNGEYDELFEIFLEDRGKQLIELVRDFTQLRGPLEQEIFGGEDEPFVRR